jgi:hypothetical protein
MKRKGHYPLPVFKAREEMVGMQKVIRSWIGAKWFTPIMVDAKQPPFKDYWKRIWRMHRYNIHHPDVL